MDAMSKFVCHGTGNLLVGHENRVILRISQSQMNRMASITSRLIVSQDILVGHRSDATLPTFATILLRAVMVFNIMVEAVSTTTQFRQGQHLITTSLNNGIKFVMDSSEQLKARVCLREQWNVCNLDGG